MVDALRLKTQKVMHRVWLIVREWKMSSPPPPSIPPQRKYRKSKRIVSKYIVQNGP